MKATLRPLAVLVSVLLVVGCVPPTGEEGDAGAGGGGGSGGSGGSGGGAPGTVTVTHTALPIHLRVQVGNGYRDTPSIFDGGITWTGNTLVTAATAQDTYSAATSSATGNVAVALVSGGVEFSMTANVSRASGSNPVVAMLTEEVLLCITGTGGSAKLSVNCVGTVSVTGSGISSLFVGTSGNDGAYCNSWAGPGAANVALPLSGTATTSISGGKACFPVKVTWTHGVEVSGSPAGTVGLSGGKVTVTAALVP